MTNSMTQKEEKLGFVGDDVGTHSIRSGGAMALALARVEEYRIKLHGRGRQDGG